MLRATDQIFTLALQTHYETRTHKYSAIRFSTAQIRLQVKECN